jgi:hypothetical protein
MEVSHFMYSQTDYEPVAAAQPKAQAHAAEPVAPGQEPPITDEQAVQPRPGKKNARSRRSSVPSWDEIMLGSSRQRD